MGANLSGGRAGRLCRRTARPRQHRSAKEAAKGCRRRSAGRSAATACGERLPKKLASLGFGRRATPAQKTLVVQKLRQKHALKPQDQGKAKGLAACNSQTASPFGCLNNFYFKILSNFWGSLQIRGRLVLVVLVYSSFEGEDAGAECAGLELLVGLAVDLHAAVDRVDAREQLALGALGTHGCAELRLAVV